MTIGDQRFAVTLADTDAARAFAARLPLTLDMAELNGNEKYADVSQDLPSDPRRPGVINAGDVMLYRSRTIVLFYETFSSSYSYTRIGQVDKPGALGRAVGAGNRRVRFSISKPGS